MERALRLMVYDKTKPSRAMQWGLTSSWVAGGSLYRALGRIDAVYGALTWEDALAWLCSVQPKRAIDEIQYWGHGRWGRVYIGREFIDKDAVDDVTHSRHGDLTALRARMTPQSLWWFRTCETFGKAEGHAFATSWAGFFNCRAAGHTYVIGPFQSGLHSLSPNQAPSWPVSEGVRDGDPADPAKGHDVGVMSSPTAPNTITCFHGAVPEGW